MRNCFELIRVQSIGKAIHDLAPCPETVPAIGTGKTATPEIAQEAHAFLRSEFEALYGTYTAQACRILYGGSVKPGNLAELLEQEDIDGGLVGGASLEAESFVGLLDAASRLGPRPV